jgi:pilus assembly protein CpaE
MADKIRVIVVDDLKETRDSVTIMLQFEPDVEVIGQGGSGEEGLDLVKRLKPDVVVMDVNMPGMDGITASREMVEAVPGTQIIIMSVQSDRDYLRGAMRAGARDFLTKPFSVDELLNTVRNAYQRRQEEAAAGPRLPQMSAPGASSDPFFPSLTSTAFVPRIGHVVTVFSPTGGVGCSTVAINTAVSLVKHGFHTVLMDGSFQFGDIALMLKMRPNTTISDLLERSDDITPDLVSSVVQRHPSGLHVLLAPPRPEMAIGIRPSQIKSVLDILRQMFDFVVIDTNSGLDDTLIGMLDQSDRVILLTRQSLASLKNASRFLDVAKELSYAPEKVTLVVNGGSDERAISLEKVGTILKRPVATVIPADSAVVEEAANQGVPFVDGNTRKRPVSKAVNEIVERLITETNAQPTAVETPPSERRGCLPRLFRRNK